MKFKIGIFLLICTLSGFGCETASKNPQTQRVCGGIAALRCDQGQECRIENKYPDATGFCVPTENETRR